jgi:hypothetical protein
VRTLSSRKKGVAFRARNQEWGEWHKAGIIPQQGVQELVGTGGRQRVEPELGVIRLTAPAVVVLGPIVDQQQQAHRRQALDQAVEERLRLAVDPV